MGQALAAVMGALTVAALVAGQASFAIVVVTVAIVLLADFAALMSSVGSRPVVLAAALPATGIPVAVAIAPSSGWTLLPVLVASGVLGAFVLVLAFGRRRAVTAALGATALTGLIIGLGAGGLLLLRALPEGFRWALGVLLVAVVVDGVRTAAASRAEPGPAAAATVAVALAGAGLLSVTANPPFSLFSAAGVAAVALLSAAAAGLLREGMDDALASVHADTPPGRAEGALPPGALSDVALPVLLAAPAAYALARLAAV